MHPVAMKSYLPDGPPAKSGNLFTEEDWNDHATLETAAYALSKVGLGPWVQVRFAVVRPCAPISFTTTP